jgi:energy-coupling factor transporter ATP-binding protein EcfA2
MVCFRIQNYKKIDDSGPISCDALTVLVGKNEAGKSSLFRALSKLNPSDGEKYDGLKEFPRGRYTAEFKEQDWPVSSVTFGLSPEEKDELSKTWPALKEVQTVTCTRFYSWKLKVDFDPSPKVTLDHSRDYLPCIEAWKKQVGEAQAPEGKGDALGQVKAKILAALVQQEGKAKTQGAPKKVTLEILSEVVAGLSPSINEEWQRAALAPLLTDIDSLKKELDTIASWAAAHKWVEQHLPKFVYFDRYDVIDSAVHLPTFLTQLSQNPHAPRVRATKALFEHVGLDIAALQKLDPTQPQKNIQEIQRMADERAIQMNSASVEMTKRFADWWEQRRHRFRYNVDGPMFRVWVSDDLDPSEIELDQRSAGMQYFFSFYLVFLVEAKAAHANSILLLDEAGLQLHGTAQAKIVKFLEKLSGENQALYTTHSPFMIDGDHLERVRVVYEDPRSGTTKVSEDVWPRDKDSLFPLQAALGYAISQSLFFSPRQLVVEGITDYWLLKAMNRLLSGAGKATLREDVIITPAGGAKHMMPLAAVLSAHKIDFCVLVDGDEPGRNKGKEVKEKLLVDSFFVSDYCPDGGLEIEDMFTPDVYWKAVEEAYPNLKGLSLVSGDGKKSVVARVQKTFESAGRSDFEKWRVAKVLANWIDNRPTSIPSETIEGFVHLFSDLNAAWKEVG